jgi:hypothetical protein
MNARQLIVLAGLAIVSVAATAAVMKTNATTVASDRRGEAVLPALRSQANELASLTIRDGNTTFAVERRDNNFVSDAGYPVKLDTVREVVTSSAELGFEESRTSDPARYGDLGLADPGGENGGKEIVFRAGSGEIADIILGNRDATVGSARGGQYVRLKGGPQTWLARGTVQLPANRADWFVPIDFNVKRSEIKALEMTGGDLGAVAATAAQPGEFTLQNVPEKRTPESFKVSQLATLFDAFGFQDVRRRTGPAPADARHITAEADGLRLTLTNVGALSDGWVQIKAEATDDAKREQANVITTKTDGFEFRLPSQQTEILSWTANDVTAEAPEPPPAEQPGDQPGAPPATLPATPPGEAPTGQPAGAGAGATKP